MSPAGCVRIESLVSARCCLRAGGSWGTGGYEVVIGEIGEPDAPSREWCW